MKISYEEIERYCNNMYGVSSNIKTILENINTSLNKLNSLSCWQGNGYEYFYDKLKNVTNSFDDINNTISNNIKYLEDMATSYSKLDKKIVTGFTNIFDFSGK